MLRLHGKYLLKSDYTQGRQKCLHPSSSLCSHCWEKCMGRLFPQRLEVLFTSENRKTIVQSIQDNKRECHEWSPVSQVVVLQSSTPVSLRWHQIILSVFPLKAKQPRMFDVPAVHFNHREVFWENWINQFVPLLFFYRTWLSEHYVFLWLKIMSQLHRSKCRLIWALILFINFLWLTAVMAAEIIH